MSISKGEVQRLPKISHPKAFSAAPNGRDIQKIWRHNVNLNVIVLCLMEGIFTKCDGYLIQRTFLVPPRGAGVIFSRMGRGSGIGRYQLQGLHGTSMHSQMGCFGFLPGVYAEEWEVK